MQDSALTALMEELFPLAEVITPNLPEAERLCGFAIEDEDAMLRAAEAIGSTLPGGVLVKGGHRSEDADDLLWRRGEAHWYRAPRVDNPNNHAPAAPCPPPSPPSWPWGMTCPGRWEGQGLHHRLHGGRAGSGAGSGPLKHNYAIKEGGSVQ